jgi:hypothetical protein
MTTRRRTQVTAGLLTALVTLTGCGKGDSNSASVPGGWGTLKTKGVSVSYPKEYEEQGTAARGKYNAAAAVWTKGGKTVSTITVQLGFTQANSAEQAAIGAEAGIQMGASVGAEKDVKLAGTDDAKLIDFTFRSTGEDADPPKGTPVKGVILAGLDSSGKTFAIRVDRIAGTLSDADLKKVVASVEVH